MKKFIVIDRYGNELSIWQSLKRRLWALQFQKRRREHEIKYGYDFDYAKALSNTLKKYDLDNEKYGIDWNRIKY